MIHDMYPLRAQYRSGEPVSIALELEHEGNDNVEWRIETKVYRLDRETERLTEEVRLAGGESLTLTLTLQAYRRTSKGSG